MRNIDKILATTWMLAIVAISASGQTKLHDMGNVARGPFQPAWQSLAAQYRCPEWFRDAKFGIWAVWGPQSQPEEGDWYARNIYMQGSAQNKYHVLHYGPPSVFGFKDVIPLWKGENFHPDDLIAFYKQSGARYFLAMANHHDNFDNFNSHYQPWNSVALGPKKDIIGLWAEAARKSGLRFGVSVHASHAWSWYEPAQGADKTGPLAGFPYDGRLTKADGKGLWWDGFDPQDLYAQNHSPGEKLDWEWNTTKGSSTPSEAFMRQFYLRTKQLWDDYHPDMVYFDDTVLPFHGVTDEIGLDLAAHFYNSSIQRDGRNEAVMTGKFLDPLQRKALVYDLERGRATEILPEPWQTDTCIGDWQYNRELLGNNRYKTAGIVIPMLADIVSKNGNLMLSIPVRGDGTIDSEEVKIVTEIGAWLRANGEAIYATRPWKIFGEGPAGDSFEKGQFDGERDVGLFTAKDVRFTQSKDGRTLYAIVLAFPENGRICIKSLAEHSPQWPSRIGSVRLLGVGRKLKFTRDADGLHLTLPENHSRNAAFALKISH